MTNGAAAGGATGAGAAAIAQAIKASGAIIRVEPTDFMTILKRAQNPLVVCSQIQHIKGLYFIPKPIRPWS
ncbi:MAG: hypothetical protein ACYSW7_10530 [Planctomycetota bacterium]|jgi:hypothetical protein